MDETDAPRALYRAHLTELQSRLARALHSAEFDGLVIFAGRAPIPDRDDQPYPFRAEPFFVQWCPLTDVPDAALVLEPGRKPRLLFPRQTDFWHVPPSDPTGYWCESFTIEPFTTDSERDRTLSRLGPGFACIGAEPLPGAASESTNPDALLAALTYQRACKTQYEIECIAQANRIAAVGHRAIAREFAAGGAEFDLNLAYLAATRQTESDLPYPNIVALNEHASVLHYQHLDRAPPGESRLLLVDAGARCAGYAADITRTTGAPATTPGFVADLVAAMDAMQRTLAADAQAGVDFVDLNETAHRRLAVVLAESGLVTCGADEAWECGLTRLFLPHGLGHLLGLQVHDVGGWQQDPGGRERPPPAEHRFLRLTRRLEPGFVVTIEPGLYIIDSLLAGAPQADRRRLGAAAIDRLRPYGGIRIEDDVVAKARDNTNLTRGAFASLEAA